MAQVDVYSLENKKVGTIELADEVFNAPKRKYLLTEVVHWQRAKRRSGTQSVKTRGEVHGTSKKPHAQKGTGRARQGDNKAPHMRGGGVAFAPKPRSYDYALPKAKRRAALAIALSVRNGEGSMKIVKDFNLGTHKTSGLVEILNNFSTPNTLIVDVENQNLQRGARNLPKSRYLNVGGLNVYDVLNHRNLILTEAAAKSIEGRLTGQDA
jgi:large subunit ribosomal protein L4